MTASNVAMIDDFNPRSHEGSDDKRFYKKEFQHISIHAPTRGATANESVTKGKQIISIHAPTRGATYCSDKTVKNYRFQSTLPRGERHMSDAPDTPAVVFQSTLPRGERPQMVYNRIRNQIFQSTLPRGERPALPASGIPF